MKFITLCLLWSSLAFATPAPSDLLENVALAATFSGNAMTIRLKTATGSDPSAADPVRIAYRSPTSSLGTFLVRKVVSAVSTVVSSGSTGGCVNAFECPVYVYALDNAGVTELAWSRTYFLDELQTTVAEGGAGAADNSLVLYSTTLRSAKAVRLIGILFLTEATAGTWVTTPSKIRLTNLKVELIRTEFATITAGGVVTEGNNSDWISGNCGVGGSTLTCSFTANTWGSAPVCVGNQTSSVLLNGINISTLNTATLTFNMAQAGGNSASNTNWICTGPRP